MNQTNLEMVLTDSFNTMSTGTGSSSSQKVWTNSGVNLLKKTSLRCITSFVEGRSNAQDHISTGTEMYNFYLKMIFMKVKFSKSIV